MMSNSRLEPTPTALITANRLSLATLIAKGLQRQHWSAVIVDEGGEILELLDSQPFQLLVLDLDWLGELGLGLLTQLQHAKCPTPVLVMTSYEELGDRAREAFDSALTVLIKPFKIQDIVQQSNRVSHWSPLN